MKLNDGYENATTLKELRTYVEYSGNEAEILKSYYGHRKCKSRFRYSFSTRMTELPQDFHDEWNGKIKSFKELYFGKYLTQEYFESDPTGVLYLSNRWAKHDPNMMHYSDVSERYNTLMDTIREYKSRFRQCEDLDNYTKFFSLC